MRNLAKNKNKARKQRATTRVKVVRKQRAARKLPKGKTLVGFLMDETGSMAVKRLESVHGFEQYVKKIKAKDGARHLLSLRFFSTMRVHEAATQVPFPSVNAKKLMSYYRPLGGTPLYDAIADMVESLEKAEHSGNILVVILTDGEENSSRKHNKESIKALIQKKEAEGWNFMYLGCNQDAWLEAQAMGLGVRSALTYGATGQSLMASYLVAADATLCNTEATRGMRVNSGGTLHNTREWQKEADDKEEATKAYIVPTALPAPPPDDKDSTNTP